MRLCFIDYPKWAEPLRDALRKNMEQGLILRIETTVVNVSFFKHYPVNLLILSSANFELQQKNADFCQLVELPRDLYRMYPRFLYDHSPPFLIARPGSQNFLNTIKHIFVLDSPSG